MIPVYNPLFKGNEKKYLQRCIDSGWVSSDGYFVRKLEEEFAKWSGNRYAVAVCNGTAALETALFATEVKSIVIPDSTIISCVLAPLRLGIHINNYFNRFEGNGYFDNSVMTCHLFGYYSKNYTDNIHIEDASQYWKPFKVKSIACYSLYANKMITSGEGGILVTNNRSYYERAKLYRNLSHSRERFIHRECAYNFRMSNLQAAVALAQLEQIDNFISIKQHNRDLYKKYLPDNVECMFDVEIPWMYLINVKDARNTVIGMKQRGIDCRRFFYPLHRQPCLKLFQLSKFPSSTERWEHLMYLPSGLTLTKKEIVRICKSLKHTLTTIT